MKTEIFKILVNLIFSIFRRTVHLSLPHLSIPQNSQSHIWQPHTCHSHTFQSHSSQSHIPTHDKPTLFTPTVVTPTVVTPTVVTPTVHNPTPDNPTAVTPTIVTPTVHNPTPDNPRPVPPTLVNPTVHNPTVQNPTLNLISGNPTVHNTRSDNPTVHNPTHWVVNCREHVIQWYKSNNVGFIQNYSYLSKLQPKMAHMPIFYYAYFSFLIFEPLLAGKWTWLPRATLRRFGASKPDQKNWANCCLEIMFLKIFRGWTPLF